MNGNYNILEIKQRKGMKENNYNILLSEVGTKGMEEKIRFVAVL